MSQKQVPELELNNIKFFLSQFEELYNDIELLKKQRSLLELPLDLSINLAPVDMNDENSYLQALRDYEKSLQQGVKDPLIFGLKKIFEQTYREFREFSNNASNSFIILIEEVETISSLDTALIKLTEDIPKLVSEISDVVKI